MIIAFANKKLEVNAEEKEYLSSLQSTFGEDTFVGLFQTNSDGVITTITPSPAKPTQVIVLFFLLNLMLNQRLRKLDHSRIDRLEERIAQLEKLLEEKNG
jgi:hypothetical protein